MRIRNPARTHSLAKPNERMGRTHQHMLLSRALARYGSVEARSRRLNLILVDYRVG